MSATERPALESEEYWEMLIKKSVSRFFLLSMLEQRPMHGYDIARNIEMCCEGFSRPTDGMIYPTIKELVQGGYIECVTEVIGGRKRKVCHLTQKGTEAFRTAARVWSRVLPYLEKTVEDAGGVATDREEGGSVCGDRCAELAATPT